MLEERVKALETGHTELKATLQRLELGFSEIKGQLSQLPKGSDLAGVRSELGEIKGRIASLPSTWQLLGLLLTTWAAGAAIVFTIIKFGAR